LIIGFETEPKLPRSTERPFKCGCEFRKFSTSRRRTQKSNGCSIFKTMLQIHTLTCFKSLILLLSNI